MSALTDLFTSLANKIRSKLGITSTYTPAQAISAIDDVYDKGVADGATPTQEKTTTAGTSAITVTPDSGYALSKVTVNPTPSQTKSATPSTSAQTISPDSGKLLSSVSVGAIATETKTQAAGTSNVTVTPTSGKYLTSVTVTPTPTQEKTVTASRSAQTVTPDSRKHLSKVTVDKYPDATGTYTYPANSTGGTYDMGTTNNLRYVNASNVYAKGKADGAASLSLTTIVNGVVGATTYTFTAAYKYIFAVAYDSVNEAQLGFTGKGTRKIYVSGLENHLRFMIYQNVATGAKINYQYYFWLYGLN